MPKNKLSQLFVAVAVATATLGSSAQQTPAPAFTFKKYIPKLLTKDSPGEQPSKKQPNLVFSANAFTYATTAVGSSSGQSIVIMNTGDGTADITPGFSIREAGGVFSNLTTNCLNTLLPGGSCSVSVTFTPVDSESYQGHLDLQTANAGNASFLLDAAGDGSAVALLTAQPGNSIDYGLVEIGSSKTQLFTFSNTGNATDRGVFASVTGIGLAITTNTCGTNQSPINLSKGSLCNIGVEYTPNSTAVLSGQLLVNSTAASGVKSLNLVGRGGQAVLDVSTNNINYSSVELGSSSTLSFIVYNTGNSDAPLSALPYITAGSSSYFEDLSTNCGAVLGAGASCAVSVKFTPTAVGSFTGSVEVASVKGGTKVVTLTGAGSGHAVAQLAPKQGSSTDFADVAIGQNKTNYFVFTNTGNIPATNVFASVTGSDVSIQNSTCGILNSSVTLAPGATCEVAVKFSPTSVGALSGSSIAINSSATEGTNTLNLSGAGTGEPIASLYPENGSSTNYGIVEVGQSKTQTFIYKNVGNIKDTNVYAYLSGSSDIAVSNNTCGTSSAKIELAPNQSCSFNVTFSPTSKVAFTGFVNISSAATSGTKQLGLTAIAGQANLEVSTPTLNYSTVEVGSSKSLSVTVLNSGDVTANITPAVAFAAGSSTTFKNLTTSCGATLAVGTTCNITADFVPSAVGPQTGSIDIKTNNANNVSVGLTGTGSGQAVGALAAQSGSSTDFGLVEVGKSKSQTFIYSNTGNIPDTGVYVNLTGTALSVTSSTCGTQSSPVVITAGQSCSVTVKYAPTDNTAFSGNLKIESSAVSGTKSLALQGVAGYAELSPSTSTISYNSVEVGSNSTLSFAVQNTGNVPAALSVPQLRAGSSAAFGSLTTNCGATLNPGISCTVSITFTPTATGAVTGFVDVGATNASTKSVALSGTGSGQATASLTLKSGYSADFGYVKVGTSAYTEFVFKNTGNISATGVYPAIVGSGLSLNNNTCGTSGSPVTISPNATCSVGVLFSPQNTSALTGAKITVNSSAASGTNFYNITGSGATAVASLSGPGSNFGNVNVGSYGQLSFSYQNIGNATASGVYAYVGGSGVSVYSTTCGTQAAPISLAPNGTCSIDVRYTPTNSNTLSNGLVGVSSDAVGGVSTVSLSGQGVQAQGSLSPANGYTTNYGSVGVGGSLTQTYVFQNIGNASATGAYVTITGADYSVGSNTCGSPGSTQTIAVGATCSISVAFSPSSSGTKIANLYVYSSAANSPASLALSGSGQVVAITDYGPYKAWANSTSAGSCNGYRYPSAGYSYSGAMGSGIYRIDTGNTGTLYVYCDMDTAGGGWTLVGRSGSGGAMGWYSSGGSVSGTGTYSLGVLNYNIPFSQIMFGGGSTSPSNSVGPYAYYHNVSRSILTSYTGSMVYLDTPGSISGSSNFRMAANMGYTSYEGFFFRDCCGYAGYGLYATGWLTAYGDGTTDIQGQGANAAYGGYLNNRHGAIYVR